MGRTKELLEELHATDEYNELLWYTLESESEN
jgi:hypothetical protein